MPFGDFYRGKKVLVTGDTGFKGAWLATWLAALGAEVHGLGLKPNTQPSLFEILRLRRLISHAVLDIRDAERLARHVADLRPDVVFHLAAQAIVRVSYREPLETLDTNVMGTAHVLSALGAAGYTPERPCVAVVVTSDKCYENPETLEAHREEDPMGGHDIYSASKGAAELVVSSWRRSFFTPRDGSTPSVLAATCRAGNVIGGGDWAADRIVADSVRTLSRGQPIPVRNPRSVRPWQHVLEPLSGYLALGAAMGSGPEQPSRYCSAWNFGPGADSERTVGDLCDLVVRHWGEGSWRHTPEPGAVHEAKFLKLAIDKAARQLGWRPAWPFEKAVEQTIHWYREAHQRDYDCETMRAITRSQIDAYAADAAAKSVDWAVA